jgi:translation initiation factor IF-2
MLLVKVRINDLARELEIKSKAILDVLAEVGITEEKTHASPVSTEEAERVRTYFRSREDRLSAPPPQPGPGTVSKIDLSRISKPGDVLTAILQKQQAEVGFREEKTDANPLSKGEVRTLPLSAPSPQLEPDTINPYIDLSLISKPAYVPTADVQKPPGDREIVVCRYCRLRQFVTINGMCRRCRKSLHPSPAALALPPPDLPARLAQNSRPARRQPIYDRATSTVPRVATSSSESKAHTGGRPAPRVIMPHTGPRPVYTATATMNGVKQETAALATREQDAIKQAEEALKMLRAQEKQRRREGDPEY